VGSGQWFRRSVATEYVLIAAVLTITAIMTSFFSPEA
jgi:putative copper export protein